MMEQNQLSGKAEPNANEKERLKALDRYDVHDVEFEEDFKDLLEVVAALFHVPMVTISFMHEKTITLQTVYGLDIKETPREHSFCESVLKEKEILVLNDTSKEPDFANNPYIAMPPYVRFYAGVPLQTYDNFRIGCLQILDTKPRTMTEGEKKNLITLGRQVMTRLDVSYRFYDLRKARAFYQSLVDNLPDIICILRKDINGTFTFVNKNFCNLMKKQSYEIIGKTDFDFYPPELAKKYRADDEKAIRLKETIEGTEINKDTQNKQRYVRVVKVPLFEPDNPYEIIGIQTIFWDETARIEGEQKLRNRENLLQCLLDMSADAIYFKDKESRFVRVSKSMLHYFGLKNQKEIIGKRDSDFFEAKRAEKALADEKKILKNGISISGKVEKEIWRDGHITYALTNKAPLKDVQGNIIGTFGISKNITKLIKTEEALKLARDKALDAMRLKGEFLANMSHEIRTPMNVIIGMTEQLGTTSLNLQQKEYLSYINGSANSLLAIINDVLDFSKIDAGKLTINLIDFNLHQVIADTVYPLAQLADRKKIELLTQVDDNVPEWGQSAPERIQQILTNLIANAIKFTSKGEVLLNVSVQKQTKDGCVVEFSVKDTGIGIAANVIPKLFTAFSQADGSTTRKYGGTGLGLAICKRLTDLLNGDISVTSTPGQGSTFTFHIPIKNPVNTHSEGMDNYSGTWLKGKNFLIVDDNRTNRQILKIPLERAGATVTETECGKTALALLSFAVQQKNPFHFALLDYQMPEMDGLMLAEEIRKNPTLAKTSLILLTSVCSVQSSQTMSRAGIDRFLVKPIRIKKLMQCIDSVLRHDVKPETLFQAPALDVLDEQDPRNKEIKEKIKKLKILLAEDMDTNKKVFTLQLKQMDAHADIVSNGAEAIAAVQAKEYDVVFMDCQMPIVDGYQASQKIRLMEKAPNYSHPPVFIVAMTANAMGGDRELCLKAGMNDYLAKPIRQNDLVQFLVGYVQQHMNECSPAPAANSQSQEKTKTTIPEDFDMTTLKSFRSLRQAGQPDPLAEAVGFFNTDAERNEPLLRDAVAKNDLPQIRMYSHGLKGICTNLGAKKAGQLFLQIETAAREGKKVDYPAMLAPALTELTHVKQFLEVYAKE